MKKQIEQKIRQEEYAFLRENENLGENIILLTAGGSIAYGTNVEGSDTDIRGVAIERPQELFGLGTFEHFEDRTTDTVIYGFKKMVNLLMSVNPNVVELLGVKDDHIIQKTKEGELLRDNLDIFLTRRVKQSFGGYASQQLRRMQNALARDNYPQEEKEQHILNSIRTQLAHLQDTYTEFGEGNLKLYLGETDREDIKMEIKMDVTMKGYPLRDFKNIYSEMSNVVKEYEKLNHRNKKKDDLHLNKHAMHLVRLLKMGVEILEGKGVNTYRGVDRDFLLDIRHGKYQKEDSSYRQEFFELVDSLEKDLEYAYKHTELPTEVDKVKVSELMQEVYRGRMLEELGR